MKSATKPWGEYEGETRCYIEKSEDKICIQSTECGDNQSKADEYCRKDIFYNKKKNSVQYIATGTGSHRVELGYRTFGELKDNIIRDFLRF